MKSLLSVLGLALILLLGAPVFAHEADVHDCVPFAAVDQIPDPTSASWDFTGSNENVRLEEHNLVLSRSRSYRHKSLQKLHLAVYEYFGEVAMMAWACRAGDEDPVTHDVPDHMIAVMKDGMWYSTLAQAPEVHYLRYVGSDTVFGVIITLRDKNGNKVAERSIERPTEE